MSQRDTPSSSKGRSWLYWVRVKSKNAVRYLAMLVVIVSVWHFFAPFISIPVWPAYQSLMPSETVAVGPQSRTMINVTHLLPMIVGAVVAWKL